MRSDALNIGFMKPDNRLRVSENGFLKIIWHKREDVAGGWEVTAQLRTSESLLLVPKYYSCDQIKK